MRNSFTVQQKIWHHGSDDDLDLDKFIYIFRIKVDSCSDQVQTSDFLSIQEINKANRFRNLQDAKTYITSKYFLRIILSEFLETPPKEIKYSLTAIKKPSIDGLNFNLSHNRNYVLIAVSKTPIGIDVEFNNPDFDYSDILDICCNSKEAEFIKNGKYHTLNFFTVWTRKEALLKASGEGLIDNLHDINSLLNHHSRNNEVFLTETFVTEDNYIFSLATLVSPSQKKKYRFLDYTM